MRRKKLASILRLLQIPLFGIGTWFLVTGETSAACFLALLCLFCHLANSIASILDRLDQLERVVREAGIEFESQ